jgi:WD40 repeat protein
VIASSEVLLKLDTQNPWPGPAAYDEASSEFFYGRREEAAELLRLVRLAPLTVVYGKSGLGKTSLLQAGLFPLLRAAHFLPVLLRLDFSATTNEPPLQQAMRRLQEELGRAKAEHSAPQGDEGLWEYLHRRDLEAWSEDNFPLVPVLVFDQFEELFSRSRGNVALITEVFDGLADLIENRIPADIAKAAAGRRARLDLLSQRYRVILSFREDFLPEVRTWEPKVPSLLRNYLRLDPMSRTSAIEAVQRAGRSVLDPGVEAVIVDFVGRLDSVADADKSGMVIEPVLLSLCCYQLNRRRAPGALIDEALVLAAGQDILDSFYRGALDDPEVKGPPDAALFIEDFLVQGDHYRGDYPAQEALDEHRLTSRQLEALTDRHRLLRIVHHPDTTRVELIHDRLVPVVRKARDERRIKQRQDEQERLAREAQADRDRERARSEELQRQRDEVTRSLRSASIFRNIAAAAAVVSLIIIVWGWRAERQIARERQRNDQIKLGMTVAAETSRLAEGRLGLQPGGEPLEQTMYRGLAAYRLSTSDSDQMLSEASAASLIALHTVMEDSSHLRKALTIHGFVPTPALSFSPDGKTLAVGGEDGLIRLLDAETYADGGRLDCRQSSPEPVWALSFNGDGTRLAAGYANYNVQAPGAGLVCVFDVPRRSVLRTWSTKVLRGRSSAVYAVAYSPKPETDFVVSGGSDQVLRLLDVKTGNMTEIPHEGAVNSVAVSADGSLVASGSVDAAIRVWRSSDLANPTVRPLKLVGHGATINQVTFSPADSSALVSASDDGRIMVWNVTGDAGGEGCLAQRSKVQPARIYGFAVRADGQMIAAAGADGNVRLFRLSKANARCGQTKIKQGSSTLHDPTEFDVIPDGLLSGHGGLVLAAAYNPRGNHLASAGQDGSIRIWSPKSGAFSLAEFQVESGVTALAISPDGKSIAGGDENGGIRVWDRPQENSSTVVTPAVASWTAHGKAIRGLAYIQIGGRTTLVSGADDGVLKRWDSASGTPIGPEMADGAEPIRSLAVSPDARTLAAASRDGAIRLWNAANGERVRRIDTPGSLDLYVVGFSADGKHLAVGAPDPRLRVIDLEKPYAEHWLQGHSDPVRSIASGGARWLLSAAQDGSVLEWQDAALAQPDTESLKKQDDFRFRMRFRDGEPLTSMAVNVDGRLILTGGDRGQVQLWDGVEHVLIGVRFPGHRGSQIRAVALAPDGSFFATADASKILVWPGPQRWADIICSKLVWNMSHEQWREWISPAIPYREQCQGLPLAPDSSASASK